MRHVDVIPFRHHEPGVRVLVQVAAQGLLIQGRLIKQQPQLGFSGRMLAVAEREPENARVADFRSGRIQEPGLQHVGLRERGADRKRLLTAVGFQDTTAAVGQRGHRVKEIGRRRVEIGGIQQERRATACIDDRLAGLQHRNGVIRRGIQPLQVRLGSRHSACPETLAGVVRLNIQPVTLLPPVRKTVAV